MYRIIIINVLYNIIVNLVGHLPRNVMRLWIFRFWPSVLRHRVDWQTARSRSICCISLPNTNIAEFGDSVFSEMLVLLHNQSLLDSKGYKEQLENCLKKLMATVWELRPFCLIGYWKESKVHSTESIGHVLEAIRESPDKMCHYFTHNDTLLNNPNRLLSLCILSILLQFTVQILVQ